MTTTAYIDDDIATIRRDNGSTWELYWGDPVERMPADDKPGKLRVATRDREGNLVLGWLSDKVKLEATSKVLTFSMIDVQQGDGMILETPKGKVVMIDGGDNKLFARHAAARYPATTASRPQVVEAIIVTHGDADHFEGLSELKKSESDRRPGKAIFVKPKRIYHNGIVKRPGKKPDDSERSETEMFGSTVDDNGTTYANDLVDDPRSVSAADRNAPFNEWCDTLDHWEALSGGQMAVSRVDHRSDPSQLFDFLHAEGIKVEIFGPIVETVHGGPALPFLRKPPDDARLMLGVKPSAKKPGYSASHTINGHSINLRLTYGNVRLLLTGDMNQESMARVNNALNNPDFECEILKAPHHGSADFDMQFLRDASPVVSLISSGDESVAKEYIHPRATLMSALGKASRDPGPGIIFNTELAAFFAYRGWSIDQEITVKQEAGYEGFERLNFGIIHIRTDGERVLAFTHSGKAGMNEAYRFTVDAQHQIAFAAKVTKQSTPKL
ncbi:MAG: MBL fold metallo-hydrolase [Sphingorhabdus sp.]|uniref:ComEC/Rec2 family competence protein n=1 Tax=Sphingorhabdus sp. TaxID=1902408 RepID=UPI003CAFE854